MWRLNVSDFGIVEVAECARQVMAFRDVIGVERYQEIVPLVADRGEPCVVVAMLGSAGEAATGGEERGTMLSREMVRAVSDAESPYRWFISFIEHPGIVFAIHGDERLNG